MSKKPNNTLVTSRADLRAILQRAGVPRAAAERMAEGGWAALNEDPQSPIKPYKREDIEMSIQALREKRNEKSAALQKLALKPNFSAEVDQPKFDKLLEEQNEIDREIGRYQASIEDFVASVNRSSGMQNQGNREHAEAFTAFLRSPHDMRARQNLADMEIRNISSGGTDAGGGFLIPEFILGPLMQRAVDVNPFRNLVRVVQVQSRDVNFPLSNSNSTTGWVGEAATRTATTEATVSNAKPTFGTLYAYVEATEELVVDSAFDIGSWFSTEAGGKMGTAEMASIISGNGTDKPTGLLNAAPTTGADGSRAAGVLKYLPTGNASTLGAAPSDLLITTVYDLKAEYRSNATWVMNSTLAGEIRKLKDSQGRFLWTDGIAAGEASTLLGYPVRIAESMPGVAANTHPILFGDFSRAYILCENGGLRVTLDDNVTVPGRVKWYIRRRVGGTVYDNDAVRAIKVAAT